MQTESRDPRRGSWEASSFKRAPCEAMAQSRRLLVEIDSARKSFGFLSKRRGNSCPISLGVVQGEGTMQPPYTNYWKQIFFFFLLKREWENQEDGEVSWCNDQSNQVGKSCQVARLELRSKTPGKARLVCLVHTT